MKAESGSCITSTRHIIVCTCAWLLLVAGFLIPLIACGPQAAEGAIIREVGSTTVQPVAERLAHAFEQQHPEVRVIIQGGGSSVGIKSVAEGLVDLGASSRDLRPTDPPLYQIPIARDLIAIIVHPSNPLQDLTMEQVVDIFAGRIGNWQQLGGPDLTIDVVSRDEGSGTRDAFEELVLQTRKHPENRLTERAILQPSNGSVRVVVATDPRAIGYVSLGFLEAGDVKGLRLNGVAPTEENALNGTYPVVRPLLFLTREEPAGLVKKFIDFCLSDTGQRIVREQGYVPIRPIP